MTTRNIPGVQQAISAAMHSIGIDRTMAFDEIEQEMRQQAGINLLTAFTRAERNALIELVIDNERLDAGIEGELQLNAVLTASTEVLPNVQFLARHLPASTPTEEIERLLQGQWAWMTRYLTRQGEQIEQGKAALSLMERFGGETYGEAVANAAAKVIASASR